MVNKANWPLRSASNVGNPAMPKSCTHVKSAAVAACCSTLSKAAANSALGNPACSANSTKTLLCVEPGLDRPGAVG